MSEEYWNKENIMGVGAGISSSPKFVDGKIIFGAHDTFVYALDPETGKIIWKFKTNGCNYADLAFHEDSIYVGSQDGHLYALDLEGNLKWEFLSQGRITGSPVYGNENIYFGNDNGNFFALNTNGKLLWKFFTGNPIRVTPALINDKIIFGSHDHNLYCMNKNGSVTWKFLTGGPMWTYPCVVDEEGRLLWSIGNQIVKESEEFYVYFGGFDGGLYCLNEDGNFVWKFHTNGPNTSGPEFKDNTVYFGSVDGHLYAIDWKDSKLRWKFKVVGKIGHSSPSLHKDSIFFGDFISDETSTGGNLYCINDKGEMKWRFQTYDVVVTSPLIVDDTAYVGSWDGFLYAISIKRQQLLWKFRTLFEKINFDITKAVKHMREQEEKTRRIFSIWKPETAEAGEEQKKSGYEIAASAYNSNKTIYGGSGSPDNERFSYSSGGSYTKKRGYSDKESDYK